MNLIARMNSGPAVSPVSPRRELGAYEALWLEKGATFKTLAERFAADPSALPSDFVTTAVADARASEVLAKLSKAGVSRFGTRLNLTGDYPAKLRDARHPVEMLYFQGTWELTETRCVAVVGSREATEDGLRRAAKVSRALVEKGFTVVSGLAAGIDAAAHNAAIEAGGRRAPLVSPNVARVTGKSKRLGPALPGLR
jgi:DNA processing protein